MRRQLIVEYGQYRSRRGLIMIKARLLRSVGAAAYAKAVKGALRVSFKRFLSGSGLSSRKLLMFVCSRITFRVRPVYVDETCNQWSRKDGLWLRVLVENHSLIDLHRPVRQNLALCSRTLRSRLGISR